MKRLLATGLCILLSLAVFAQEQTVTGVIRDAADNAPLPGVSVRLKGARTGTTTANNGSFTIRANKGQVLVFSFVGYKTVEVTVGDNTSISLNLVETVEKEQLSEVVVTAMDIKRNPKELGYSVQKVGGSEIQETQRENFVNALQGRIAGVTVTPTNGIAGASSSIVIRGFNSMALSNQPLFVVDGIIMDNQTINESGGAGTVGLASDRSNRDGDYTNRIADINPNDIESITVLKGPEATALYGSQASSGAIIITTKKSSTNQKKLGINYDNSFRVSRITRFPEITDDFLPGSAGLSFNSFNYFGPRNPNPDKERVLDNLQNFYRTGLSQTHNLSLDYGIKNSSFRLSGSLNDIVGVVPFNNYNRYNFRLTNNTKIGKYIDIQPAVAYANTYFKRPLRGASTYMLNLLRWPVEQDLKNFEDPDGNKLLLYNDDPLLEIDNPLWNAKYNNAIDVTNRWTYSLGVNINPAPWVSLQGRFGYDTYKMEGSRIVHPKSFLTTAAQGGQLDNFWRNYYGYNHTINATFRKSLGKFNGRLMLGTMWQDYETQMFAIYGTRLVDPKLRDSSNTAVGTRVRLNRNNLGDYNRVIVRQIAYFGEAAINYDNKIFLNYTHRFESASTLPAINRNYNYPGASLSMIMSDILPGLKGNFLSFWKLRTSFATTARLNGAYSNQSVFENRQSSGGGFSYGFTNNNFFLEPEKQETYELGTEFRLFNSHLNFDVTYYNTLNKDQIVELFRSSYGTGFVLNTLNVGTTRNQGIEVAVNATPVSNKNFRWNLGLNFNHMWNKVLSLPANVPEFYISDTWFIGNARGGLVQGGPTTAITSFGYLKNDRGQIIINPTTGLPVTENVFRVIGDRNPTFTLGINNNFRYKNLSISMLWDLRVGGDMLNGTDRFLTQIGRSRRTADRMEPRVIQGVLQDGLQNSANPTPNNIAVIPFFQQTYYTLMPESEYLERNINWFRLQDITVSYNLTSLIRKRTSAFKSLSAFVTANNLVLFTNYTGADPAVNGVSAGSRGVGGAGFDLGNVANPININLGIRTSF